VNSASPGKVDVSGLTFYVLRFTLHVPAIIALLVVAAIYVGALFSLPPDAFTHHDEGAKYLQVRNLRLAPSGLDWSINYPARRLDPQLEFVPFHPKQHYVDSAGRIYLQWPIFLGQLTRIPWKVMQFWGLYVVPLLAGLGTVWVSYLLALRVGVPGRAAWLAIPLVGLATPIAQYSLLYFEHTLAALLVALSMLFAVKTMDDGRWTMASVDQGSRVKGQGSEDGPSSIVHRPSSAWSGALLALAVYFRSELYVLALVMAVAFGWVAWKERSWRPMAAWVGGFVLMLVPLWAFYAINEGTLLPTHALWYFAGGEPSNPGGIPRPGLPPLRYIATAGWGVVPAFLFGPETVPFVPMPPGWVEVAGLAGCGLCALAALARLVRRPSILVWRLGILALGLALLLASTAAVLLSPQPYYNLHGFLLAAPFVVLALWPDRKTMDDGRWTIDDGVVGSRVQQSSIVHRPSSIVFLYAVTLAYVGLHALVISALSGLGPISLHEWGQRYLLPAYPLLTVLALAAAISIWAGSRSARLRAGVLACLGLWVALVMVGLGFTVRGYTVLQEERAQVASWQALVRSLPPTEPLVTDVWWLPLNLAADFYTRPMMLAEGEDRLAQWVGQMRTRGVSNVGLATTDPAIYAAIEARLPDLQANGPPREARGVWLQRYSLK
jgi:hypothetical protein